MVINGKNLQGSNINLILLLLIHFFMSFCLHRLYTTAILPSAVSNALSKLCYQRSFASKGYTMSLHYTLDRAQEIADNLTDVRARMDKVIQKKDSAIQKVCNARIGISQVSRSTRIDRVGTKSWNVHNAIAYLTHC